MRLQKTSAYILSLSTILPISLSAISFDLNVTVPDIVTTSIDVNYDSTANVLTAVGLSTNLKLAGDPNNPIFAPGGLDNYTLTANIDENGELYEALGSYGTVTIEGAIDYDNNGFPDGPSETILIGEIFGFDGGFTEDDNYPTNDDAPFGTPLRYSEILEFRFEAVGGSLMNDYLNAPEYSQLDFEGNENKGGIILASSGFAGDWISDWTSGLNAASDTSVTSLVTEVPAPLVPEPATAALLLGLFSGVILGYRRLRN